MTPAQSQPPASCTRLAPGTSDKFFHGLSPAAGTNGSLALMAMDRGGLGLLSSGCSLTRRDMGKTSPGFLRCTVSRLSCGGRCPYRCQTPPALPRSATSWYGYIDDYCVNRCDPFPRQGRRDGQFPAARGLQGRRPQCPADGIAQLNSSHPIDRARCVAPDMPAPYRREERRGVDEGHEAVHIASQCRRMRRSSARSWLWPVAISAPVTTYCKSGGGPGGRPTCFSGTASRGAQRSGWLIPPENAEVLEGMCGCNGTSRAQSEGSLRVIPYTAHLVAVRACTSLYSSAQAWTSSYELCAPFLSIYLIGKDFYFN